MNDVATFWFFSIPITFVVTAFGAHIERQYWIRAMSPRVRTAIEQLKTPSSVTEIHHEMQRWTTDMLPLGNIGITLQELTKTGELSCFEQIEIDRNGKQHTVRYYCAANSHESATKSASSAAPTVSNHSPEPSDQGLC